MSTEDHTDAGDEQATMSITQRGRYRDEQSGVPVDILELDGSAYDEVRVRFVDQSTVQLISVQDSTVVDQIGFTVLEERYLGLQPNTRSHTDMPEDLRTALLSAGYVAVDKDATTPTNGGTHD